MNNTLFLPAEEQTFDCEITVRIGSIDRSAGMFQSFFLLFLIKQHNIIIFYRNDNHPYSFRTIRVF